MPLTIDSLIKATRIIPLRPDAHPTFQHEVKIRDTPQPRRMRPPPRTT